MRVILQIIAVVAIVALYVWFDNAYADSCRKGGGTVVRGARDGTLCIESPSTAEANSR